MTAVLCIHHQVGHWFLSVKWLQWTRLYCLWRHGEAAATHTLPSPVTSPAHRGGGITGCSLSRRAARCCQFVLLLQCFSESWRGFKKPCFIHFSLKLVENCTTHSCILLRHPAKLLFTCGSLNKLCFYPPPFSHECTIGTAHVRLSAEMKARGLTP